MTLPSISRFFALILVVAAGAATATEWAIAPKNASIRPLLGGGHLYLGGEVGEFVEVKAPGKYIFTVRASGSKADGEWPEMALSVDGMEHRRVTVASEEYEGYSIPLSLEPGTYALSAAFRNDSTGLFEDRNLYLERFALLAPEGAPAPVTATGGAWEKSARAREASLIERTGALIQEHRTGATRLQFVDADGQPIPEGQAQVKLKRHAFLFGCNIAGWNRLKSARQNAEYKRLFEKLFNYATVTFYWRFFEPEQGKRLYDYTDQVVAWCTERSMAIKGHPLLWGHEGGIPPWLDAQPGPELQKAHVLDLVSRYKESIGFWDVVNEPANEPGIPLGPAHRWAHEADPAAELVVNEYGILAATHEDFYKILVEAKAEEVPFHVVGIQGHAPTDMAFLLDRVWQVLDHYAALGKPLHITEFTPPSDGSAVKGTVWRGQWTPEVQAEYAEKFYRVCFAHPAMEAISWWDFADEGAWVKGGGMLTADLKPKPVYEAIRSLIQDEWTTKAEGQLSEGGLFDFRGYFGAYEGILTLEGKETPFSFELKKGETEPVVITLP